MKLFNRKPKTPTVETAHSYIHQLAYEVCASAELTGPKDLVSWGNIATKLNRYAEGIITSQVKQRKFKAELIAFGVLGVAAWSLVGVVTFCAKVPPERKVVWGAPYVQAAKVDITPSGKWFSLGKGVAISDIQIVTREADKENVWSRVTFAYRNKSSMPQDVLVRLFNTDGCLELLFKYQIPAQSIDLGHSEVYEETTETSGLLMPLKDFPVPTKASFELSEPVTAL